MMKKLLLLSSALFAFHFGANAQTPGPVSTPTTVTDTLNYFVNKQVFKVGGIINPATTTFGFYKAPSSAYAAYKDIMHFGAIFRNSDTALMVNGLEGWASRDGRSLRGSLPVHFYLCKLNPATGLPIMPPVDSVLATLNNICGEPGNICPPVLIGGDLMHGPKKIAGDFAVLIRNYAERAGDTIRFYRTSSLTSDNVVLTGPGSEYYKTGENLGLVSRNGVFYKTTHYLQNPGFGWGTDYEFCVAPRVTFQLQVSQIEPANASTACVFHDVTYTNTSSPELTNKQFNLNEFYRQLKPFQLQPASAPFYPDSVLRWFFDDDPRIDTVPFQWGRVQDMFLGVNQTTIHKYFDTAGVFNDGTMIGKYRKMTGCYSNRLTGMTTFATNIDLCGGEVGINEINTLKNVNVYPNPAVNSKVTISGLKGKNTIVVYDMLGQVIATEVSDKENVMVDLLKQPAGSYMIRVTNAENKSKSVKVINQKN